MEITKNSTWNQKLSSNATLKGEIKSIFHFAKKCYYSHSEILSQIKDRVYDNDKFKTLPNYMQSRLNGYIDANFDIMYIDHIEWVHWYDGEFVHKNLPYGKNFDQNKVVSNSVYKGTEKIY